MKLRTSSLWIGNPAVLWLVHRDKSCAITRCQYAWICLYNVDSVHIYCQLLTKNRLKRRERSNTNLIHVCRLPKRCWMSQCRLKASAFYLFTPDFLCSVAICRHKSGRCRFFPPLFNLFFLISPLQGFHLHVILPVEVQAVNRLRASDWMPLKIQPTVVS